VIAHDYIADGATQVLAPAPGPDLATQTVHATDRGLAILAAACWPESAADHDIPTVAGFVVSTFSPLIVLLAERCLHRHAAPRNTVTAVIVASSLGDTTSAMHVAAAVDTGLRVRPLMFFQSVPNAVAGYLAARWDLTGPVVCVANPDSALDVAALLLADGDADDALVIHVEVGETTDDSIAPDRGTALLLTAAEVAATATGQGGHQWTDA
jgi:beta-ketoacyl synthase-like protein